MYKRQGLSDLEEPEHADIPSPHKLAMQDDEEEDTERLALEAIDAWHKKWTHRLSTDGRSGGPVVDRLEGEDVFLAHNIDYLKRRNRFKTMFAKLQIDSSADQVIYGKKAKAKDGASRDLLEDPPADMAVFEEEEIRKPENYERVLRNPGPYVCISMLGFLVILTTLGVIQTCGSLTFKAAGQVRNIGIIVVSMAVFGDRVTVVQAVGYAINVVGFCMYQVVKTREDLQNLREEFARGALDLSLIHI